MIRLTKTVCSGCYVLQPLIFEDIRGVFVKSFNTLQFEELGLRSDFSEQYYTSSRRRVLRGMHFQAPPMHHSKLVFCVEGRVLDVALDLRQASATYQQYCSVELSSVLGNMVYLEPGFAHGFYVLSEIATVVYNVTSVFSPEHDQGVRWNSFGLRWPDSDPILSVRDANLPLLADIKPFK